MKYLVCYELALSTGSIAGDIVYVNAGRLTESVVQEMRAKIKKDVLVQASSQIPSDAKIKNLIFRSITKLAD